MKTSITYKAAIHAMAETMLLYDRTPCDAVTYFFKAAFNAGEEKVFDDIEAAQEEINAAYRGADYE